MSLFKRTVCRVSFQAVANALIGCFLLVDVLELCIPVQMVRALAGLYIALKRVILPLQKPAHKSMGREDALIRMRRGRVSDATNRCSATIRNKLAAGLVGALSELRDICHTALPNREPLCVGG